MVGFMSQTPEDLTVLGIAKRIHGELAEMPPQSHEAVVSILAALLQHRAMTIQISAMEKQRQAKFAKELGLVQP